jgi:hypothetical protein
MSLYYVIVFRLVIRSLPFPSVANSYICGSQEPLNCWPRPNHRSRCENAPKESSRNTIPKCHVKIIR